MPQKKDCPKGWYYVNSTGRCRKRCSKGEVRDQKTRKCVSKTGSKPARKTTARKTTARKKTARKTTARKTTARSKKARKTTARKTTVCKAVAKTTVCKAVAKTAPAAKTTEEKCLEREPEGHWYWSKKKTCKKHAQHLKSPRKKKSAKKTRTAVCTPAKKSVNRNRTAEIVKSQASKCTGNTRACATVREAAEWLNR